MMKKIILIMLIVISLAGCFWYPYRDGGGGHARRGERHDGGGERHDGGGERHGGDDHR